MRGEGMGGGLPGGLMPGGLTLRVDLGSNLPLCLRTEAVVLLSLTLNGGSLVSSPLETEAVLFSLTLNGVSLLSAPAPPPPGSLIAPGGGLIAVLPMLASFDRSTPLPRSTADPVLEALGVVGGRGGFFFAPPAARAGGGAPRGGGGAPFPRGGGGPPFFATTPASPPAGLLLPGSGDVGDDCAREADKMRW